MKKSTFKKFVAFALVVMMLASTCVINIASAANLTITVADDSTTTVYTSGSADGSALTDGVKTGSYTADSVSRMGSTGYTNFALAFATAETFDTIKVYSFDNGSSFGYPSTADKYAVTVDGVAVDFEFETDATDPTYPVAVLKLASAVTTSSAVVTVYNQKYLLGVFEIEVENNSGSSDDTTSEVSGDYYYYLDMEAPATAVAGETINVVFTVKNIKEELAAVEFFVDFDDTKVAPVITEPEKPMDAFMTVYPKYTAEIFGQTGELPAIEQICYYNAAQTQYELRFLDLLDYPGIVGEEPTMFINDGDLVVTVPFLVLDTVVPGDEFTFSLIEGTVCGTTSVGLNDVPGTGDSATVVIPGGDTTSEDTTVVTSDDTTVETSDDVTSEATSEATSEVTSEVTSDETDDTTEDSSIDMDDDFYYYLDMEAPATAVAGEQINVVFTVKNIKEELAAVEFFLDFDHTKVAPVITEVEKPMDAFMTKTPMYEAEIFGQTGFLPAMEQICYYNAAETQYELRFLDLLDYPGIVGEEPTMLVNDGDLIVTIPFLVLDTVAPGDSFTFSLIEGTVCGTTSVGLNDVPGTGDSATVVIPGGDTTSDDTTVVTSDDTTVETSDDTSDVTSDDTTSEDQPSKTPVDLGDNFYANINVPALGKVFTVVDGNIRAEAADDSDSQVWNFVKIDDTNAYTIKSALGGYVNVGDLDATLANVAVGDAEQTFYIYSVNGKYVISPVGYDNKAVDVNGVDFNVQYWNFDEANACQQYDIVEVNVNDDTTSDETTEDTTSEDVTSEETSDDVTSEDVTSEDVTSEETSEDVTSEETSDDVTSEETSDDVTSEETSDDVTSEETSDDVTSEETSDDVTSDETSDDVTSEETSDDILSDDTSDPSGDNTTSDDVTSDDATSDVIEDTTSDETSDGELSDDATSDDATSDVTEDTTSDETSEEDPGKPGDAGIVAFVVLAILSLAAVVVCKKATRA